MNRAGVLSSLLLLPSIASSTPDLALGSPDEVDDNQTAGRVSWDCAGAARGVALVLRGHVFRWGCSAAAVEAQRRAISSYLEMVVRPHEASGGCVDVFSAANGEACGAAAQASMLRLFASRLRAHSSHAAPNQAEGVRHALGLLPPLEEMIGYEALLARQPNERLIEG